MTRTERDALEAVLEEHRQTRRPVSPGMIAIACNVRAVPEREAVERSLQRLSAQGLITASGQGWVPTPGAREALEQQGPSKADSKPSPEAAPMDSGFKQRRALRRPAPKPCQAAGCDRPALDVPNASLCEACRDAVKWPAGKDQPAPVTPTIPVELLDRCAAMHLTLLEQAREAYAKGNESAGRELAWLIETGEQLVAAGGEAA